jgi:GT2 family glycosyltransferase
MAGDAVSVVIPTGSVDDDLRTQLRAVLAQEAPFGFEVVISLNTPDAAARTRLESMLVELGDQRVRWVDSSVARGAAHARNVGLAAAAHDVVAFCDADDVVQPGWLASLVAAMGQYDVVGGHLDDLAFGDPKQADWRPPATPGALPTFLGVPYIVSANLAVRREHFVAAGGFDTSLVRCEDVAIGWAFLELGLTLGYVADAVVAYRHRPGIVPMLRQHYLYGRGMSQVLHRYGVPHGDEWAAPSGLRMLRPNGQRARRRTVVGARRRASIAAGRVVGLVEGRLDRKPVPARR